MVDDQVFESLLARQICVKFNKYDYVDGHCSSHVVDYHGLTRTLLCIDQGQHRSS